MIKLTQLAKKFEDGLNAALGDPEIQFKIWANAGEYQKALRGSNRVYYTIHGNLRSSSSANEANRLVMGVNGLTLDFCIPVKQPKTNANQTAEELQRIKDGQYEFVEKIISAINLYFQNATSFTESSDEISYSISLRAGMSTTGTVDMLPGIGNCVTASVYIECYFLENGVNSQDVRILIDGVLVPYLKVQLGRYNQLSSDVYAGERTIKNVATASAFSIDLEIPATGDKVTAAAIEYLLHTDPNAAHFVEVSYGASAKDETYLMIFDSVNTIAQGVTFAGITVSLIETVDKPELLSFPEGFEVGRFVFGESQNVSLNFAVSPVPISVYLCGKFYNINSSNQNDIDIPSVNSEYMITGNDVYYVYMISSKKVIISDLQIPYEVLIHGKENKEEGNE